MDFIPHIKTKLSENLRAIIEEYEGEIEVGSLSELERAAKEMSYELGAEIIQQTLEAADGKYPIASKECKYCGGAARYIRRREGMSITLQGRVYYRRAYYSCKQCGKGHYPLDERLKIKPGEMSAEVVQMAALLGIHDSFKTSSDVLARTTLLELSPNSIRKACHLMGERVIAHEEKLEADSQDLEKQCEHKRTQAPRQLYGSMDGFMVLFEDGWHEMKGGTWWTLTAEGELDHIQYYVDSSPADEFTHLVWATGFEQLADQAAELIFVTDGAEWIERIIRQHFPHASLIVDWYHACEYLTPLAPLAKVSKFEQAQWLEHTITDLWEGRIAQVIEAASTLIRPHLNVDDDPAQKAVRYFSNQRSRMNYPLYRQKGYSIGSGIMESACKQLGLERLKIAGARWGEDRVSACKVAKARAAYLSHQWDLFRAA